MSNLLIQEVPLMVLPTLATKIGLNEAMFLQQLHYWIDRSKHEMEGHRWIYNTIEDWCNPFYGYFLRHCKKGKDIGTPEADNGSSSGT